jgi:hypothetical protein
VTCDDGDDNDCDGLVDAADPDCDVCVSDETPEQSCFDGNDNDCNDCDEAVDCADTSCNGETDGSCNTGQLGICAAGTRTCSGGGEVCQQDVSPQEESPAAGTCNDSLDNDCDGQTDTNDPDCNVCMPTEPTEVSCFNSQDDDCDEAVDCSDTNCDGALGAPTSCGEGVCASTGNETCSGGAPGDTCTPGTPGVEGPFGDTTCNDGLDNDCDGLSDANDPDCEDTGGVVCEDITVRNDCKDQPTCQWKKNACITR